MDTMTFLVAAIEHHARVLATSLTRALTEKCSGYSDYEAGDFLAADTTPWPRRTDIDTEAVAEPPCAYFNRVTCELDECHGCGIDMPDARFNELNPRYPRTQTPAAGQRGENPAGVTPPTPAGSPDPSPTIVQSACQPTVGDEGSPEEIATFPDRPSGERPTLRELVGEMHDSALVMRDQAKDAIPFNFHNGRRSALADVLAKLDASQRPDWPTWAVPAICDVLAEHQFVDIMTEDDADWKRYGCYHAGEDRTHQWLDDAQDWREHVAPLIAERLDTAWRARQSHKPQK